MKIGLVSTHAHPISVGLRYVSSYLKAAGHDVRVYFMSSRRDTAKPDWTPACLEDFTQRLKDVDLIGMSLMTNTFKRACVLTETLHKAGVTAPIVWGGTHPTVAPEESVEIADAICVGEGEEAMLQLAERLEAGRDPTAVRSLWLRGDGPLSVSGTVRNPLGPLQTDIDRLPFPDYELDTHWVADHDGLVPAKPENLRGALHTMRVVTTRGCPYHCAFCNNTALKEIHTGQGPWVRLRSLDNVLTELRHALASFPTIERFNFVDDLFFVRTEEQIEEFAKCYDAELKVPLELDAFPNTVSDRKVAALSHVSIGLISMGIESASTDTLQNIYRRPTAKKRIAEAIAIFKKHRVPTEYHYIVSNPYEPDANVIESMRFIADHHQGHSVLRVFPLMFYPGTPLYQRACQDGRIDWRDPTVYDHMGTGALQIARHDYLAMWLRCVLNLKNVGVPRWVCHRVIDVATSRPGRFVLDRKWFGPTVFAGYVVGRKLYKNFIHQPFIKPFGYLRRGRRRKSGVGRPWKLPAVDVGAMRARAGTPKCRVAEELAMPEGGSGAPSPAMCRPADLSEPA